MTTRPVRRPPVHAIVDNLVWAHDGVWACWEVAPVTYRWLSRKQKLDVHARLRAALLSIRSEALLLGVFDPWPWDDLVTATGGDRDGAHRVLLDGPLKRVGEFDLARRRFVLAVRLDDPDRRRQIARWWSGIAAAGGLPGGLVPAVEIAARRRQADDTAVRMTGLQLEACRPGMVRWLYARVAHRGLVSEPSYERDVWDRPRTGRHGPVTVSAGALWDHQVVEGGGRDDADRPRHGRYVRVDNDHESSFQAYACVSDMPHEWMFPGGLGEWLTRLDDHAFPVDWAVRVHAVANAAAQHAATRQARELDSQRTQHDDDTAGPPPALEAAIRAIDVQRAILAANPHETELWATTIVSVAAPSSPELEARVALLQSEFAANAYGLHRPTGGQVALLEASLPGFSAGKVCADYRQIMLAADFASAMPFTTAQVGDPTGMILAVTSEGGLPSPVLFDPARGPKINSSASIAMSGQLGSGKSQTDKTMAGWLVAEGGQFVTLDRTPVGEYVKFARAVGEHLGVKVQVIEARDGVAHPVLIDPLRVFRPEDRERTAIGFLGVVTGYDPRSDEGAALDDAVRSVARRDGALRDVLDELTAAGATDVARRVRQLTRGLLGQLAFGDCGEQLDLSAAIVVFWCPQLALPTREQQTSAHLASQLTLEHYESMGLLYLCSAAARTICWSDTARFSVFNVDEAWALRANLHGEELLKATINDGRKHNAAVWLATPHPEQLVGLTDNVPIRFVFRQDQNTVAAAARLLGGPDLADVADVLASPDPRTGGLATGECFLRDVTGRVARVQILPPGVDWLAEAVDTNPDRHTTIATAATGVVPFAPAGAGDVEDVADAFETAAGGDREPFPAVASTVAEPVTAEATVGSNRPSVGELPRRRAGRSTGPVPAGVPRLRIPPPARCDGQPTEVPV